MELDFSWGLVSEPSLMGPISHKGRLGDTLLQKRRISLPGDCS